MRSFYFPCASVFEVATLVHSCCLDCTSVTEQGWNICPWKILLYCQNKWENVSKPPITYNRLQKAKQNHARKRLLRTKWRKEREGYTFSLPASTKITKKKIYTENIQTCACNNRATTYLGLFQGDEGLYGKPWDADPWPKSRLWSCSINCDRRSLKKSSLVVSSTRVDDGTAGDLPYSTPCDRRSQQENWILEPKCSLQHWSQPGVSRTSVVRGVKGLLGLSPLGLISRLLKG